MFFSGFSLQNESELFKEYLILNDFCICGFSYGATRAFEYVYNSKQRIDRLQLFSPAFFQNKNDKFKRMQMMFFAKDANQYANNFLINCGFDHKLAQKYFSLGKSEELQSLLDYVWDNKKLQELVDRGTKIEVYLGGEDKIIDSQYACDFFKSFAEVYFIKDASHILR